MLGGMKMRKGRATERKLDQSAEVAKNVSWLKVVRRLRCWTNLWKCP